MANNDISYNGFTGSIETSIQDQCLHGRILFIDDLITYEGETVPNVVQAFQDAVNRYLDYCERTGKPTNKPYSGSFNVRIGIDRHREVAQRARNKDISINELVCLALDHELHQTGASEEMAVNHNHTHVHEYKFAAHVEDQEFEFTERGQEWQTQTQPQR